MSPETVGAIGILAVVALTFAGVQVGFAMMIVGTIGFSYIRSLGAGLHMLTTEIFGTFSSFTLSVVPMFVFMGSLAFAAAMSGRLYEAARVLLGRIPGGLAIASTAACAGFAAVCGSTTATAAAVGAVALPEMKKHGYADTLATGCVAAAGGLGILIPPSAVLIVYGIMTEQSIGQLFIAGVLPGLLLAFLISLAIILLCWRNKTLGPAAPSTTFKQKLGAFLKMSEALVIFGLVMGGLYAGWFTPTQAGAGGAAAVLLVSLIRRSISWHGFLNAVRETVPVSCMVMVLIAGGFIFGRLMAVAKIPFAITDWAAASNMPPIAIMAVIILVHLIGGCFMDAFAMVVISIPIIYPVVLSLGYDPIWFGIIIILIVEMGGITPPVGLNVFVIKGIAKDVPLETVFKGILPFIWPIAICIVLLMVFPQIATFLPRFVRY
jgi:C4-dicarboxylate transporter DctM subunit